MLPCIEVGYIPGVAEIVEAGVVVEKETEHTRLGSDKSHFSALSTILLTIMSYIIMEEMVIVTLPLQPDLWLDFTPDQDSRLLGSHYSGLVCPKRCGGVIVFAMAGRMPGHFHSFSEDWAPSKPVRTAPTYSFLISNHSQWGLSEPTSLTNIGHFVTVFLKISKHSQWGRIHNRYLKVLIHFKVTLSEKTPRGVTA